MVPNASLTPRQKDVLALYTEHANAGRPPPTYAEIAKTFHWRSRNAAKRHVLELIRKGALTPNMKGVARGTSLAAPLMEMRSVLVNAAGKTLTDLPIPSYMFPEQGILFVFQMPDQCMKAHAILENDLIFVGPKETPVDPRLVVVSEKGELTVSLSEKAGRKKILGVVAGVMRSPAALAMINKN